MHLVCTLLKGICGCRLLFDLALNRNQLSGTEGTAVAAIRLTRLEFSPQSLKEKNCKLSAVNSCTGWVLFCPTFLSVKKFCVFVWLNRLKLTKTD